MTDHHANPAYQPEPDHSTSCPYHMALYLHSLIKAAGHLVDSLQGPDIPGYPSAVRMGLPGLMTVICERADALSQMLEDMDPDGWAKAKGAVRLSKRSPDGAL